MTTKRYLEIESPCHCPLRNGDYANDRGATWCYINKCSVTNAECTDNDFFPQDCPLSGGED